MAIPIVYHYPGQWARMYRARQRCLMEAISEFHPVYFLSDASYSGRLIEFKRPHLEKINDSFTVVHDTFGVRTSRMGKRMGSVGTALDARWLHSLLASEGVTDYVYWLAAPAPERLPGMRLDRFIFDNHDPNFFPEHQAAFDAREALVVSKAKLVFATAEILLEKMQAIHPNAHILPNAAVVEDHYPDYTRDLKVPEALKAMPRPYIGYIGTFDWRMDFSTLTEVARRMPHYTFVLAGRVNADQEHNVKDLRSFPNVLMPGQLSQEDVNAYTAAFDVGLIPFTAGPIGDGINPTKLWCYLMAGKPIVSTWLRECRAMPRFIYASKDVDAFTKNISLALDQDTPELYSERLAFSMENTYRRRAQAALEHIKATGLLS